MKSRTPSRREVAHVALGRVAERDQLPAQNEEHADVGDQSGEYRDRHEEQSGERVLGAERRRERHHPTADRRAAQVPGEQRGTGACEDAGDRGETAHHPVIVGVI